jgi:hypothetical protein
MPLRLVALNSDVVTPADGDTVPAVPSRYAATHSRAAKRRSRESTSRSTAAPRDHRQNCLGPRTVGLAALADPDRSRTRRPRDHRPRLGRLGDHPARERASALESEGLRQQRSPPRSCPRRPRTSTPTNMNSRNTGMDHGHIEVHCCPVRRTRLGRRHHRRVNAALLRGA